MKKLLLLLCLMSVFFAQAQNDPGTYESLFQIRSAAASNLVTVTGLGQIFSSTGHYTLSADGKGMNTSTSTIRVNKPTPTATVQKAILMSTVTGTTIGNNCVTLHGTPIIWNASASSNNLILFSNYWADVTSILSGPLNSAPAGISNFSISECNTGGIDGEALLVVFNDPTATEKTIIIMFGAASTTGDNFSVSLAQPIDPSAPGALLDMGLGIGFGFQRNGGGQVSQVSVNGNRLTSSAGGEDDGASANGALITVGGIGDLNANPANPFAGTTNPRSDDELYNILPFITNTTTSLNINTLNPSNDDNIFLAYFALSGAAIIGEGILLSQTGVTGNVGSMHTGRALVKNSLGQPLPNKPVTFTIISGPNSGMSPITIISDANGEAIFTYTGSGGAGTDQIQACFTNSQSQVTCSNTLTFLWIATSTPPTVTCPQNISTGNDAGLCGANVSYAATATDNNCPGNINIVYSPASGSFFAIGTTTVNVTATDACGNSSSCSFTVTVNDTENPSITCNGPITVNNTPGICGAAVSYTVTSADNCAGQNVTQTAGLPSGSVFPVGTTTNTFVVTDASNNSATCSFTVRVNDTQAPTISCPANITVAPLTLAGRVVTFATPAGSDNCAVSSVVRSAGLPSGSMFPIGISTVTFKATDAAGNTAFCSFTITVTNPYCGTKGNNDKVYICHKGNTICVSVNAIQAHMDHGCYLGQCVPGSNLVSTTPTQSKSIALDAKTAATGAGELEVIVSPNPSATDFTLQFSGKDKAPVNIIIRDLAGRTMTVLNNIALNRKVSFGGSYVAGTYFAEVKQGKRSKTVMLIRQ